MNILYVISTLTNSGPVNVLYSLCSKLAKHDNITILTISPENTQSRIADFRTLSVHIDSLGLSRGNFFIFGKKNFLQYVKANDFDIIHGHGFRADQLISSVKGIIKLSTAHNYPIEDYPSSYGKVLGLWMAQRQFTYWNRIDEVIACSNFIAKNIEGKSTVEVETVRNGTKKIENINREINGCINIIILGTLNKRQNVEFILESFSNVMMQIKRIKITVVGGGPQFNRLSQKYSCNRIMFTGQVSNPDSFVQRADWVVSASKSEGLPMAVMECLSANCNLIISDIGPHLEIKNVINNEKICRVFSLSDSEMLMDIFIKIDCGNIEWQNGGEKIWKQYFSSKRMACDYEKIYLRLLKNETPNRQTKCNEK